MKTAAFFASGFVCNRGNVGMKSYCFHFAICGSSPVDRGANTITTATKSPLVVRLIKYMYRVRRVVV